MLLDWRSRSGLVRCSILKCDRQRCRNIELYHCYWMLGTECRILLVLKCAYKSVVMLLEDEANIPVLHMKSS